MVVTLYVHVHGFATIPGVEEKPIWPPCLNIVGIYNRLIDLFCQGTSDLLHYRAHGCVVSSLNPLGGHAGPPLRDALPCIPLSH